MWSPAQYAKFSGQRNRPFFDLLAQVSHESAKHIADLGCGTGKLTAQLLERFRGAKVTGVDNSPEMLAAAKQYEIANQLSFVEADLSTWQPEAALDIVVSNAALQWLGNHEALIPSLVNLLAPGGVLAVQMPNNFSAPSHLLLQELLSKKTWQEKINANDSHPNNRHAELPYNLEWYTSTLLARGLKVNAWQTIYLHVLHGQNAVLEWVKGTTLRPVLSALGTEDQALFLEQYNLLLQKAYPEKTIGQEIGTVFPFERIFFVAEKRP